MTALQQLVQPNVVDSVLQHKGLTDMVSTGIYENEGQSEKRISIL